MRNMFKTVHTVYAPPTKSRPRLYDVLPGVLDTARAMSQVRGGRARVTVDQTGSPVLRVVVPMRTVQL